MQINLTPDELVNIVNRAKENAGITSALNPNALQTAQNAIAAINTPTPDKGVQLS